MKTAAARTHTTARDHDDTPANDAVVRPFVFPAMPSPEQATLPRLGEALGEPDETCRALNLGAHDAADIADLGAHSDTDAILESVPTIVVSAIAVLSSLDASQAEHVLLDTGVFAVIIDESMRLVTVRQSYDAALGTAGIARGRRRRMRRDTRSEGVSLRTNTAAGVVRALGPARADDVAAAAGTADTDDDLALGLDGLAGYIEQTLSHGAHEDRARLARYRIGAAKVRTLRAKAAEVRAMIAGRGALAPRAAHQRLLDAQEGRVLVLVRKVVTAMRAARGADRSIPSVQLGRLATLLSSRNKPKARAATGAPVVTHP